MDSFRRNTCMNPDRLKPSTNAQRVSQSIATVACKLCQSQFIVRQPSSLSSFFARPILTRQARGCSVATGSILNCAQIMNQSFALMENANGMRRSRHFSRHFERVGISVRVVRMDDEAD